MTWLLVGLFVVFLDVILASLVLIRLVGRVIDWRVEILTQRIRDREDPQ